MRLIPADTRQYITRLAREKHSQDYETRLKNYMVLLNAATEQQTNSIIPQKLMEYERNIAEDFQNQGLPTALIRAIWKNPNLQLTYKAAHKHIKSVTLIDCIFLGELCRLKHGDLTTSDNFTGKVVVALPNIIAIESKKKITVYLPDTGKQITPVVYPSQTLAGHQLLGIETHGITITDSEMEITKQQPALTLDNLAESGVVVTEASKEKHTIPLLRMTPTATTENKKIAIAIHGLSENKNIFRLLGTQFAKEGYDVFSITLPGFGENFQGHIGNWPGINTLLNTVYNSVCTIQALFPHAKLTLIGESMGASLINVLAAQLDLMKAIEHIILFSPAVRTNSIYNPSHLVGDDTVTAEQKADPLHKTIANLSVFSSAAARIHTGESHQSLFDLMKVSRNTVYKRKPVHVLLGTRDKMVPASDYRKLFQNTTQADRADYYWYVYDNLSHTLSRGRLALMIIHELLLRLKDGTPPMSGASKSVTERLDHAASFSVTAKFKSTPSDLKTYQDYLDNASQYTQPATLVSSTPYTPNSPARV